MFGHGLPGQKIGAHRLLVALDEHGDTGTTPMGDQAKTATAMRKDRRRRQ